MSSAAERETEVLQSFERVLDLEGAERAAFLAGLSAETRREVDELIALESRGGGGPRLVIPAHLFDAREAPASELEPGTRIGSFEIVELLGVGGMGRVYVALQETPRRRVALKTLRAGLESDEAFRRFQVEAELLAQMRHPGIAQIYEAGVHRLRTEAGPLDVPYLAMELLEGARPIVQHAEQCGLTLEARLRLFVSVCRAVHHAHLRGVIHRDLKPGNILVDESGSARVIDFGIARAVDLDLGSLAGRTRAGQLLGTPAYMSPEQLSLAPDELDLRVDVYALGAVLYELVCGRRPFETADLPLAALMQRILDKEPARPTHLVPGLSTDIEAILLGALAKERERRYGSAALLADDVERFLRHETVQARSPTALHQVRLFARRNRALAIISSLAVVALLAATAVSAALAVSARRAQHEAELASQRADAFLANLFQTNFDLVFGFSEALRRMEGGTNIRVGMLRMAFDQLSGLEDEARHSPQTMADLARAYAELGDALGSPMKANLGDTDGARRAYERAAGLLSDVPADTPGAARARAKVLESLGNLARAEARFEDAVAYFEETRRVLEDELELHPEDDWLHAQLLSTLRYIGHSLGSLGEHERALWLFEEVVRGRRALLERDPRSANIRRALANALASEAGARYKAFDAQASLDGFREAARSIDELAVDAPDDRLVSIACAQIRYPFTEALIEAGELDEALVETRRGLESIERIVASDPSDVHVRRFLGLLFYNDAWAHHRSAQRARSAGGSEPGVRDHLLAARDGFQNVRAVFQDLADEGLLRPYEASHLAKIDDRLARVDADLAVE